MDPETRGFVESKLSEAAAALRSEMREMVAAAEGRQRDALRRSSDATLSKLRDMDSRTRSMSAAIAAQDDKIDEIGRDMRLILSSVAGLREDLYGDPAKRSGPVALYERLDQMEAHQSEQLSMLEAGVAEQFDALTARLDNADRWMARREAVERVLVEAAKAPIMVVLKKVLPFALGVSALVGAVFAVYGWLI